MTPGDPASGAPLPPGAAPSASGGLDGFREALDRLEHRLQEASRPSRYKPVDDLSLARILFGDPASAAPVVGEILDLSRDGMKIALAVSQEVEVDQPCHLLVGHPDRECYELAGTVRWVDRNPYITVFGLALREATLHNPEG